MAMLDFLKEKIHAAPIKDPGKIYRIHVSGGQNRLSMLVCVFSPEPLETLKRYLERSAVIVLSEPVPVPTMNADSKGIDVFIRARKAAPGFEFVNRKRLHPIDRTLMD